MELEGQTKVEGGFVRVFVATVLAVLIIGGGALAEDPLLSEVKDISQLGLKAVYGHKPLGADGISAITITCSIDVADCALIQTKKGADRLVIKDLPCPPNPGRPQLPMKTLMAKLDRDANVQGIEVVSGSYREILNPVDLAPGAAPYVWMREEDMPKHLRDRLRTTSFDRATYSLDEYFPGEIATYSTGKDNESLSVYIRVFPVQYIPKRKQAILVTDATIKVYYSPAASQGKASTGLAADPAECVIICPASLMSAAELLKDFHVGEESVSTSVLTTQDIDANYAPAPNPPYSGYKDNYPGKENIVGYDYELAKKIVSYLRDQAAHPNLKYVTLLGDGELVPPSYYINESGWQWYHHWIPTDFLYTSPDYDYVPNYCVGRLPVSDAAEAASIVSKIQSWHSSLSWDWFKRASVCGGRPFGTILYYGELSTADLVNEDVFNGMEVGKYYHTDGTFDVADVAPLLSTEDSGLFYHVNHGDGVNMFCQTNDIDASDVMSYPINPKVPVMVSVACINGAYDTDLTNFGGWPDFPDLPYPTSFGESILLSEAGGIAYVGGSRLNYGDWDISYDQGRLVAQHYFMNDILNSVFRSYHAGTSRLGEMTCDALRYYAQNNDMGDREHRETVFGLVLLGDPVLTLPTQQSGPSYQRPHLTAVDPTGYSDEGVPRYEDWVPEQSISVVSTSDSATVDAKSIYTWRDAIVTRVSAAAPPLTCNFTPTDCGYYLVRSSAADGKEGWLFLNAQLVFTPSSNILLIDGDYSPFYGYERYYTGALDDLGRTYDVWEAGARDPIDAETLSHYMNGTVIWTIPFEHPVESEKQACQVYLDSGGSLFISGQEIGSHLTSGGSEMDYFYEHYLHAWYVEDNSEIHTLAGVPGDPIGDGLTITIEGGDGAYNQSTPDEIEPIAPATPVFAYAHGREGALAVDTGTYSVVYFSFGFEAINSQGDRSEVMDRILDWLMPGPIQQAINEASDGDEIIISEGIHHEHFNFRGKNLTVRSTHPNDPDIVAATVINADGRRPVVSFSGGEDASCVLTGFTITNGNRGIYCSGVSPTITNCTIIGNTGIGIESWGTLGRGSPTIINCTIAGNGGAGIYARARKTPTITNCIIIGNKGAGLDVDEGSTITNCTIVGNELSGIFGYRATVTNSIIWNNSPEQIVDDYKNCSVTYSDVQGGWEGMGNISTDPCFVTGGRWDGDVWVSGDYHLQSQAGRWDADAKSWVCDANTSRCIDAGNPGIALGGEPNDGGNIRANMGAYGGTAEASKTPTNWNLLADLTNDGTVDFVDLAHWAENWLRSVSEHPGDLDRNGIIDMVDFALFGHDWFAETTWYE